jgi:hypothetical protein
LSVLSVEGVPSGVDADERRRSVLEVAEEHIAPGNVGNARDEVAGDADEGEQACRRG